MEGVQDSKKLLEIFQSQYFLYGKSTLYGPRDSIKSGDYKNIDTIDIVLKNVLSILILLNSIKLSIDIYKEEVPLGESEGLAYY